MVCSPIAPPGGDAFGVDAPSRVPSWVRGIAQRNKLHRQITSTSRGEGSIDSPSEAPPPSTPADPDLYRSLLMRMSHADPSERCLATTLLAEVAPRGDRRVLTALLGTSGHGNATSPSGPPRGVRDADHGVQVASIDAAGTVAEKTGDERTTTVLLRLLKERDWQLRTAAARALTRVTDGREDTRILSYLCELLEGSEWHSRVTAAELLGAYLGDSGRDGIERVAGALRGALADTDWAVRKSAVKALGKCVASHEETLPAVLGMVCDSDWRVRKAALEVIPGAYRQGVEEELRAAVMSRLEDAEVGGNVRVFDERSRCDADVRAAATLALVGLAAHRQGWVMGALEEIRCGEEAQGAVRERVEDALGRFGAE
mmetsp:Transcript_4830/g.11548  ORF Transcript_4830/g.11548 Transcript_4830/m.11548 type:complete len:372 (-) Transcript_4830:330-1445(-)|eukprot:CAMPEP_0173422550 /NCGR_PEP_ID=MMETSP1357-20121228/3209_1 /TAXON_ID=77926 /ORGANISM="Hemiselmis rufescens, Strain PCC563" /LENGTH=371 /DNA_ID=CAMNT_0014385587 /DNA_START=198 /DNA_END=1313 /DNA_ORIENTATION=+